MKKGVFCGDMQKDIEASKEMRKLKRIFKNIDENKQKIVAPLIESAAFMAQELQKLQKHIAEHGCTEEYQNGANQKGKKKSSEVEVFNAMIKNYSAVIKQLCDMLPEDGKTDDELMDFVQNR